MSAESDPIFARISKRYDLINRILSFGREQAWRRRGITELPPGWVLDLGSGTGAAHGVLRGFQVVALDPVAEMLSLSLFEYKVVGVGEALPFRDASFDSVFSAYVFRNLSSIPDTLNEVARILRPGGACVVVDLNRPPNLVLAFLHRLASAVFLPVAGLIAGAPADYWYLHRSLDKLPSPEVLFADRPLVLEKAWRMGPFGFVYGAVLRKP